MADATAGFFDALARRGHEPLLGDAVGSVRFELVRESQIDIWRVALDHGEFPWRATSRTAADCVVRADGVLFDGIAAGEVNAMAAVLRGALAFEGDPELLVRLQRIFPDPPAGTRGRHEERTAMSDEMVKILNGNTFVVSDRRGDIEASPTDPTGLFSFDTRFLSKWVLTVERRASHVAVGRRPAVLRGAVLPRPGIGSVYVDAKLSVIRQRAVGDGFHEELTILNHDDEPVDLTVRIEAASRLRGSVRGQGRARRRRARYAKRVRTAARCSSYRRETLRRVDGDLVVATAARSTRTGLTFAVQHRAAR